ncbi:hypothetical protein ANN_17735 [Periplaneta americana]|uniref:Uncharacterized protein n=1 Tax=Periplaneta americana TaxID=6978 RepID=A0ABQ8STS1_PERAM|nr:hypothetical protein ANN_17735 [Periplaneta americana]
MNPIEHVWDMLGRRVKNRRPRPESLQELRRALGEEWELIPQEDIANQIESMPRRMDAVIQARGDCKIFPLSEESQLLIHRFVNETLLKQKHWIEISLEEVLVANVLPVLQYYRLSRFQYVLCREDLRTTVVGIATTLAHVLGSCPHGEALQNARHHQVRSIIATALNDADYNTFEEVHGLSVTGSTRRIDIIAFKESTRSGYIIDPTVHFETDEEQPAEVDNEKKNIYNPTIPYYLKKYQLKELEVIGLLVEAREAHLPSQRQTGIISCISVNPAMPTIYAAGSYDRSLAVKDLLATKPGDNGEGDQFLSSIAYIAD